MADLIRREAVLLANGADEQARTVPLTLSTETPVDRGSFDEILGHQPGEVDLSRAPLPLIESHDANRLPLGVIENLHLAGRKLRGLARFGKSERAREVFEDVAAGVIRSVSVGYRYLNEGQPVGERGLRFSWQPVELSAVAIGADPHAGFFRGNTMSESNEYQTRSARRLGEKMRINEALASVPSEDVKGFRMHLQSLGEEDGVSAGDVLRELGDVGTAYEQYRRTAIRHFATTWPTYAEVVALAKRAEIDPTATVEATRKVVLEALGRAHEPQINTGELELDNPGHPDYIGPYGTAARVNERHGVLQTRGRDTERTCYAMGTWIRSLVGDRKAARWCEENGLRTRVMSEGIFSSGGALVPDMIANAIIDNTEQYGVYRQNATVWPMQSASLSVPVSAQGLSLAAVAETDETPASDLALQQVALTAKEFAGGCRASRSLLEDSVIALGDFLIREFSRVLGQAQDNCGFIGDGTSTYGGIAGILWRLENQAAFAGSKKAAVSTHKTWATLDVSDLVGVMGIVPEYARRGAAWYCSAVAKDLTMTRLVASAGGNSTQTLHQGVGESFLGYPIRTSQVLPAGPATDYASKCMLLFGNLALAAAYGDRRDLVVTVDTSRYVEMRQTYFAIASRFDCNNHMTGTTATACGPIAGLFGTT